VPFVSKAIGVPLAKIAAKVMAGQTLQQLGFTEQKHPLHYSVKEAVFPFIRFPGVDIALGPEMKSTGEVMGIDADLGIAYAKSQMSGGPALPLGGNAFLSVKDSDKPEAVGLAKDLHDLGFRILATSGTAALIEAEGIPVARLFKLSEGRPNVLDMIKNGNLNFLINTPSGKTPREDEVKIRSAAVAARISIMTTIRGAKASVNGIRAIQSKGLAVKSIQEFHS
jgi:carbamoyl-phosphate synthase large subunit